MTLVDLLRAADPGTEWITDRLLWPELAEAIKAAAAAHGMDYAEARRHIFAFHDAQKTFHLEAIARFAGDRCPYSREDDGPAAYRYLKDRRMEKPTTSHGMPSITLNFAYTPDQVWVDEEAVEQAFRQATVAACQHEWASARNSVVEAGEVCTKCGAIRAEGEVPIACQHVKVFSPITLTSCPPIHPWICSKCLEEGQDRETLERPAESFDDLVRRKREQKP